MKLLIDIDDKSYFCVKDLVGVNIGSRGGYKTIQQNVINAIKFGRPYKVPAKGHWVDGTQGHYCSECGYIDMFYFEHDYCPKCGSYMEVKCNDRT